MEAGDEVYIVNSRGKDTGMYGIIHHSIDCLELTIYEVALNNDENTIVEFPEWGIRKKEKTYKIGDRFKIGRKVYVLSKIGYRGEVNLIDPYTGNIWWSNPQKVENFCNISEYTIDCIVGDHLWEDVE